MIVSKAITQSLIFLSTCLIIYIYLDKHPVLSYPRLRSQARCLGRVPVAEHKMKVQEAIKSIITSEGLPRLQCPNIDTSRYSVLSTKSTRPKYFFAIDLHNSAAVIPQLLGTLVQAATFLGPENCALSIIEGRSTDGTFEILHALLPELERLGLAYFLDCNEVDSNAEEGDRIGALAELRNMALKPLTSDPSSYDPATTIIFLNDVAPCPEDILELLLQKVLLKADMTCGMDWYNLEEGGTFYDSWIARQINGEPFFEVPQSTSWDFSKNLFWNDPVSKSRYEEHRPFQIFSCWNGAAVFSAAPIMNRKVKFRSHHQGECHLGEPVHLAKDLLKHGYGRVALIPSVNLAYSVNDSKQAKDSNGWVSDIVLHESAEANKFQWISAPGQIACLEDTFHVQSWERI